MNNHIIRTAQYTNQHVDLPPLHLVCPCCHFVYILLTKPDT